MRLTGDRGMAHSRPHSWQVKNVNFRFERTQRQCSRCSQRPSGTKGYRPAGRVGHRGSAAGVAAAAMTAAEDVAGAQGLVRRDGDTAGRVPLARTGASSSEWEESLRARSKEVRLSEDVCGADDSFMAAGSGVQETAARRSSSDSTDGSEFWKCAGQSGQSMQSARDGGWT